MKRKLKLNMFQMSCICLEIGQMSVVGSVNNQICIAVTGKGKSHVLSVCWEVHVRENTYPELSAL